MIKKLLIGSAFFCNALSYAQTPAIEQKIEPLEEVVLIDSGFDLSRENSGKIVSKITREEISRSAAQSVAQIINTVSGIEITGTRGYAGQNLGYYIRGGRNRQVVFLIDGIQVNDPSSIASDFDLRLLPLSQVESIEIIKGAASTLYGSGAATAVVSIKTRDRAQRKMEVYLNSSVGTNQNAADQEYEASEFRNSLGISGKLEKLNYMANFSHLYSDNLSAVNLLDDDKLYEEDPFKKANFNARFGYEWNEDLQFDIFGNYDEFTSHYDNYDFTDNDNVLFSRQTRFGTDTEWKYKNGSINFSNAITFLERNIETELPNSFKSKLIVFDVYNKYKISDKVYTLVGLNGLFSSFNSFAVPFGEEHMEQVISEDFAHFGITDPYINLVYVSDFGLNLNAGSRLNIHSEYGSHLVYNFNPSFTFNLGNNYLKTLFSYSTAFVTPSLYQLFEVNYGNKNLAPEESTTIETGLEYNSDGFRATAVYFTRNEKSFIDFVLVDPDTFKYQYRNIPEEFTAEGIEMEISIALLEKLNLSGNYTFTEVEERFNLRIPKHKINSKLDYVISERWFSSLTYQFNGERTDTFFNTTLAENENIILNSFGLLDFFTSYKVNEQFRIFGAVTNIINEEYRELYGYSTLGRNMKLGLNITF